MARSHGVDWAGLIDEAVAATEHLDSAVAAGLELGVDRQNVERWRKGARGVPRGRVKAALERWAASTLPAKNLGRLGLRPANEDGDVPLAKVRRVKGKHPQRSS